MNEERYEHRDETEDVAVDPQRRLHDILAAQLEEQATDASEANATPTVLRWTDDEIARLSGLHDRVDAGLVTEFIDDEADNPLWEFNGEQRLVFLAMRSLLQERRAQHLPSDAWDERLAPEGQQLADDVYLALLHDLRARYRFGEQLPPLDLTDDQPGVN